MKTEEQELLSLINECPDVTIEGAKSLVREWQEYLNQEEPTEDVE